MRKSKAIRKLPPPIQQPKMVLPQKIRAKSVPKTKSTLKFEDVQLEYSTFKELSEQIRRMDEEEFAEIQSPAEIIQINFVSHKSAVELTKQKFRVNFNDSLNNQKNEYLREFKRQFNICRRKQYAEAEANLQNQGLIKNYKSSELESIQFIEKFNFEAYCHKTQKENIYGETRSLTDICNKDKHQRAYLMCMADGLDDIAQENNLQSWLITLTLPKQALKKNDTVEKQVKYLNSIWASATKEFTNKIYAMSAIEAHHDGLPHEHILSVMDEDTFKKIQTNLKKLLPVDPLLIKNKKKRIRDFHIKELTDEFAPQKTTWYLTKTLDPKDVGYQTFKQNGIKKFKLLGKLHGISEFWKYSRSFKRVDLRNLLEESGHLSPLPRLALYAQTSQAAKFINLFEKIKKPRIVNLNKISTDSEYRNTTKKIGTLGYIDGAGLIFTAVKINVAELKYKQTFETTLRQKKRLFFKKKSSREILKPAYPVAYRTVTKPNLLQTIGQLEQEIRFDMPKLSSLIKRAELNNHQFSISFSENEYPTHISLTHLTNKKLDFIVQHTSLFSLSDKDHEDLMMNHPNWLEELRDDNFEIQYRECFYPQIVEQERKIEAEKQKQVEKMKQRKKIMKQMRLLRLVAFPIEFPTRNLKCLVNQSIAKAVERDIEADKIKQMRFEQALEQALAEQAKEIEQAKLKLVLSKYEPLMNHWVNRRKIDRKSDLFGNDLEIAPFSPLLISNTSLNPFTDKHLRTNE